MKKSICILLLSMFALISLGQIKRNIDGIVLGKTKKHEVVNYLKNKRIPFSFGKIGVYDAIICEKEISFGGISWPSTFYILYNNTVFKISHSTNDYSMSKEEMDYSFKNLSMALQRKYSQYKRANSDRNHINYQDSYVSLDLCKDYLDNHYILSLDYSDLYLMGKAFSEGDDDL